MLLTILAILVGAFAICLSIKSSEITKAILSYLGVAVLMGAVHFPIYRHDSRFYQFIPLNDYSEVAI